MNCSEDINVFRNGSYGDKIQKISSNSSKHSNDATCFNVKTFIDCNKIIKFLNSRLCAKCSAYSKKNILPDKTRFCYNFSKIIENYRHVFYFFSSLYSINYPFGPKACIMCCLSGRFVQKLFSQQISAFPRRLHQRIMKYVVGFETKLRNKLFYLCHLSIVSDGNRHHYSKKLFLYKKLEILPYQKTISQFKNEDLPTLFYGPFSYLFDLIKNKYNFKKMLPLVQKKKKKISIECYKFAEIRIQKYLDIPLLVYSCFFLKVLNQYRDKNLSLHDIFYKFLNTCDNKNVIDTITEICHTYYFHTLQNEMIHSFNSRNCLKEISFDSALACSSKNRNIIPTKTNDITKIKGWRNKKIALKNIEQENMSCCTNRNATSVNIRPENTGFLDVKEKTFVEDHHIIEASRDICCIDKVDKDGNDNSLKDFTNLYMKLLSEDIIYQNLLKKNTEKKNHEGIFTSNILDEYLENHSNLTVSFDLPELSNNCNLLKYNLPPILPCSSTNDSHKHCTQISKNTEKKNHEGIFNSNILDEYLENHSNLTVSFELPELSNNCNLLKYNLPPILPCLSTNDSHKNCTQISKNTEKKNHEGIFTSNILDEYLENHSNLTVSFDLPELSNNCNLLKYNLPPILPCLSTNDSHKHCTQISKKHHGMAINVRTGRPFPEEVAKHVVEHRENVNIIDIMWKNIVAYAAHSNISDAKIRRCLVPVGLDSLIESFKLGHFPIKTSKGNELVVHSADKSNCNFNIFKNLKPIDVNFIEIKKLLEEMLENIKKREQLAIDKPNIEEKELTNRSVYDSIYLKEYVGNNNKKIIKESYSKLNCKEEKKNFSLQKTSKQKNNSKSKKILTKDHEKIARILNEKNEQNPYSLADVFIWCCAHSRFNCCCTGKIIFLKHNKLIWKPSTEKTYLSVKNMSEISINSNFPNCHGFFPNIHSSRTVGSLFNYKLRNSSLIFRQKRLAEIRNNVLSNTNSFIKVNSRPILFPYEQIVKKHKPSSTDNMNKNNEIIIGDISLTLCKKESSSEEKKLSFKENSYVTLHKIKLKGKPLEKEGTQLIKGSYRHGSAGLQEMKIISANSSSGRIDESKLAEYLVNPTDFNISDTVKDDGKSLFKYGLLCLTEGFGFLLVKQFTADKLLIQDPLRHNIFRFFKDLEAANEWLNRFFKQHLVFESADTNLKWVIVKTSFFKYSHAFDKSLIEQSSKFVNKDGILIDKDVNSFKEEIKKSTISKHHQLNGQNLTKRTFGEISENRFTAEGVPSKKAKISCSSSLQLLNAKEKPVVHWPITSKEPSGIKDHSNLPHSSVSE